MCRDVQFSLMLMDTRVYHFNSSPCLPLGEEKGSWWSGPPIVLQLIMVHEGRQGQVYCKALNNCKNALVMSAPGERVGHLHEQSKPTCQKRDISRLWLEYTIMSNSKEQIRFEQHEIHGQDLKKWALPPLWQQNVITDYYTKTDVDATKGKHHVSQPPH